MTPSASATAARYVTCLRRSPAYPVHRVSIRIEAARTTLTGAAAEDPYYCATHRMQIGVCVATSTLRDPGTAGGSPAVTAGALDGGRAARGPSYGTTRLKP